MHTASSDVDSPSNPLDTSHFSHGASVQREMIDAGSRPQVRAEALLRRLENIWSWLDGIVHHLLPPVFNPFAQLGAIANTCLIIAVLSGIGLLAWYSPSVHEAHASLDPARKLSALGQWVRSIHRYSSDGCLFFIVLHAIKIFSQRRFSGPRWLAWSTGIFLLLLVSFIGWTGYWLVWDLRSQSIAVGTARFLDALPIFAEPISRSFLVNKNIPSLFFFLVFFVHMLTPLAVGIALWMHLMRVNRARFLASCQMTVWIVVTLAVLSLLYPARSTDAANMTYKAPGFSIDAWYLWPLAFTDRLSSGALWGSFLIALSCSLTVPFWMSKRRAGAAWKAEVELSRCIGCTLCAQDCPFNAITMIPREDGRKFDFQSFVNPDLCVGCGICTGACDSQAINLPILNSRMVEKRLHTWIEAQAAKKLPSFIAFCCDQSAGGVLSMNPDGTSTQLPGFKIEKIPCVGWVSAVMLERLVQRGASGILVLGCSPGDPVSREGMKWFGQRVEGKREPALDIKKCNPDYIRYLQLSRISLRNFIESAQEFQKSRTAASNTTQYKKWICVTAGVLLAALIALTVARLSNVKYSPPRNPTPELVVSFSHGGQILETRKLTKEELANRLPHMRAQVNSSRRRSPVRLQIRLDDKIAYDHTYQPGGLSKDGPSVALARLPVAVGDHRISLSIADGADQNSWTQTWKDTLEFKTNHVRVILFEAQSGFSVH